MTKWIYRFGNRTAEGESSMKNLLGGKGSNLAEMSKLGLNVPPGFTITTEACTYYYNNNGTLPAGIKEEVKKSLDYVENIVQSRFGDPASPLLVSVRSGARVSMPGMMDTVLNLGLNHETCAGLAKASNNPRFAADSYRRFIQMFGNVVLDIDHHLFEDALQEKKLSEGVYEDVELGVDALNDLIKDYLHLVKNETGADFPTDPNEQLWQAIGAVFNSWATPRAKTYRMLNEIPEDWGTAVNVQAMVFGNMGDDCATGVAFTRDPSTGKNYFYGEYLVNAQGEDVVAGIRTPKPLTIEGAKEIGSDSKSLEEELPDVYKELCDIRSKLESHYCDMQDIEFTVQNNKLYMLQTRSGKRSATASIKIACDMVDEKIIDKDKALLSINPNNLDQLLHPQIDKSSQLTELTSGLPASPGAASGIICLDADTAQRQVEGGHRVILLRNETSPDDIHGMHVASGILTARGGMTSHAAVVARGMGCPCVTGAGSMIIREDAIEINDKTLKPGDWITIDGSSGKIYEGEAPTLRPELSDEFNRIMKWSDAVKNLKIRTNAETPNDVQTAKNFGAEGIGLCRTEHMFFEEKRINYMRQMIMTDGIKRSEALEKLLPMQQGDFHNIFKIMEERPVTIRLLDPPLHEFLPHTLAEQKTMSEQTGISLNMIQDTINSLTESNPMLGMRGCRLLLLYPEICTMQVRAILKAAVAVAKECNIKPDPEIMIPLVGIDKELEQLKEYIDKAAQQVFSEEEFSLPYKVGVMVELPRAALTAQELAEHASFFSFGTNDLTQTTYGFSRDDAGRFLARYNERKIIENDPFQRLDLSGVGELIKIAVERGRQTNKNIKLGICGEHGGDPYSINFCETIGLDYVSCSPYRVPIAILAAAQASLTKK